MAFVAGTLGRAGAEKQLWYMTRALRAMGVEVHLFSVTQGEHYESLFVADGLPPRWFGAARGPLGRTLALSREIRRLRPHIVQAAHCYTGIYAAITARLCGAISIGAMRNDARYEMDVNGRWGRLLLSTPTALIANSQAAIDGAVALGVPAEKLHLLPNAIDLEAFDKQAFSAQASHAAAPLPVRDRVVAIAVGRMVTAKRFDRFICALARARREAPELMGVIAGDGPERAALEQCAADQGLSSQDLVFLGARGDVPALLGNAAMLVSSSDHEGFPNVVLEAMSARLPVIATPAGDAGRIVQEGLTGHVVPFDALDAMSARMVELARSPQTRKRFGDAARHQVEQEYSDRVLGVRLLTLYRQITVQDHRLDLARLVPEPFHKPVLTVL